MKVIRVLFLLVIVGAVYFVMESKGFAFLLLAGVAFDAIGLIVKNRESSLKADVKK